MRLLVTRPAEDAEDLAALLKAGGHQVLVAPVMEIRPIPGATVDLSGVQAILVTSRNGLRALAEATPRRDLPVLAVGAASAEAARAAGFAEVLSAEGDARALARLAIGTLKPGDGPLLHGTGSVTAGDLAGILTVAGYQLRRAVLYEAKPLSRLSAAARAFLASGEPGGVLFYSPRSASLFASLVEAESLTRALRPLTAFCLSEAVAGAVRHLPFGQIAAASAPSQSALLALIPLEPNRDPS